MVISLTYSKVKWEKGPSFCNSEDQLGGNDYVIGMSDGNT